MRAKALLSISLVLLMFLAAVPGGLTAAQGQPDDAGQGRGQDGRPDHAGQGRAADGRPAMAESAEARQEARWDKLPEQARTRVLQRAADARLFGPLDYDASTGQASGRFVSFGLDQASARVTDYTVAINDTNITYFSEILPATFTPAGDAQVRGAVLKLPGENATLMAHSNPTGTLRYIVGAESLDVRLRAAQDATLEQRGEREVVVTKNGTHGHVLLTGNGTLAIEGDVLRATVESGAGLLFRAHPVGAADAPNLHAVNEAITNGRFGGSVALVNTTEGAVTDPVLVDVALEPTNVEPGNVSVRANATVEGGRVVAVSVPDDLVTENLTVLLDNRTIPVQPADAVVDATEAVANVTRSEGAVQVLVNIPSFSVHEITLQSDAQTDGTTDDTTTGDGTTGGDTTTDDTEDATGDETPLPAALALVALATVATLTRRRRS